jgi:hypothetical protein
MHVCANEGGAINRRKDVPNLKESMFQFKHPKFGLFVG